MGRLIDLTDQRFGRLVVKERTKNKGRRVCWLCECDCGKIVPVKADSLRCGDTQSCGCQRLENLRIANLRHGYARQGKRRSPEYRSYASAKNRCTNTKNDAWADYGGRGIEFRFVSFEQFLVELGPRPTSEHSLDRKNVNGHYEPGNCRWATDQEQYLNRRILLVSQELLCDLFGEDGNRIWKTIREAVLGKAAANG